MSTRTCELYVEGVGLWSSRLPGWEIARRVLRAEAAPPELKAPRPSPVLLPPAERRRAPDSVAVALEVAARACESAGRDPKTMPSVFASTHGDLAITDAVCETLATNPALTSPTKFHNSVHNAAAGYWTIATGCLEPYTALSAWRYTFAQGLLESASQALCGDTPVLYVAYDIEARGPVATMQPSRGVFAAALILAPAPGAHTVARLALHTREEPDPQFTASRAANAALVEGNAMAGALPLFEAFADGAEREIVQPLSPQLALRIRIR